MRCAKCGAEYSVLRDDDDNLYRRLCACEAAKACYACKNKVVAALLDRAGQVVKYACAKHGNEDTKQWFSSPEKSKAKAPSPEKSKVAAPNGVKAMNVALFHCACSCGVRTLSTTQTIRCGACGTKVNGSELGKSEMDHFQIGHGEDRSTIVLTMMIRGHGEYVPDSLHITLPKI